MPNHIHAIINFKNSAKSINYIIANGKRFMTYGIVKKLELLHSEEETIPRLAAVVPLFVRGYLGLQ